VVVKEASSPIWGSFGKYGGPPVEFLSSVRSPILISSDLFACRPEKALAESSGMNACPFPGAEDADVVRPFAADAAALPKPGRSQGRATWITEGITFAALGAGGGSPMAQRLNDPLGTLERFPVAPRWQPAPRWSPGCPPRVRRLPRSSAFWKRRRTNHGRDVE
jgi:hypothetical protein